MAAVNAGRHRVARGALGNVRALHDYALATEAAHPDAIHWIHIDPQRAGPDGVKELRRCIDKKRGFLGYAVSASLSPPASEPTYQPYYNLCIEAGIPVLIFVGTTGLGAGLPGGDGVILDHCHPRHLDLVAARNPQLRIVAARPGWPWQAEVIAVLMHKRSIWYELHGWSPKYHTSDLKHEIPRRLKDRILFGADYPLFSYERLVRDWRAEGYAEEVLEKVFWRNAVADAPAGAADDRHLAFQSKVHAQIWPLKPTSAKKRSALRQNTFSSTSSA